MTMMMEKEGKNQMPSIDSRVTATTAQLTMQTTNLLTYSYGTLQTPDFQFIDSKYSNYKQANSCILSYYLLKLLLISYQFKAFNMLHNALYMFCAPILYSPTKCCKNTV